MGNVRKVNYLREPSRVSDRVKENVPALPACRGDTWAATGTHGEVSQLREPVPCHRLRVISRVPNERAQSLSVGLVPGKKLWEFLFEQEEGQPPAKRLWGTAWTPSDTASSHGHPFQKITLAGRGVPHPKWRAPRPSNA